MLTVDKLKLYEQFDGDLDGWARSSSERSGDAMTDQDWYLIDELLMSLATLEVGVASESHAQQVEQLLQACTSDQATRIALRALARRRGSHSAG